jgi:hypothetical protein
VGLVSVATDVLPGDQFRWRYQDDAMGEDWTDWHTVEGNCPSCCHGGPRGGQHQQGAGYYNEDGIMDWSGHTVCDPHDLDEWVSVEWRRTGS